MDDPDIQEESDTVEAAITILTSENVSDEDYAAADSAATTIMDDWNQDFINEET